MVLLLWCKTIDSDKNALSDSVVAAVKKNNSVAFLTMPKIQNLQSLDWPWNVAYLFYSAGIIFVFGVFDGAVLFFVCDFGFSDFVFFVPRQPVAKKNAKSEKPKSQTKNKTATTTTPKTKIIPPE